VVLCDIGLPGMDGYAVARALRADPSVSSAYLVAVTGYASPEDARRAVGAGFDLHLGKPVPIEVLEEVLATAPVQRGDATAVH
jgi:two-component system CheB/CheR fusion protein